MRSPFSAHIAAVKEFNDQTNQIILDEVKNIEPEIVDYVTEEQLFQGKRGDGTNIEPDYTPFTVKIKLEKGQPADRVTWKDTGALYASIRLEYFPKAFAVVADDNKIAKLEAKYGATTLGVTDEGVQEIIDMIREPLINNFRNRISNG